MTPAGVVSNKPQATPQQVAQAAKDKAATGGPALAAKPSVEPHHCDVFDLGHGHRFKKLVECRDCHWQSRVMTDAEAVHQVESHKHLKEARRPF